MHVPDEMRHPYELMQYPNPLTHVNVAFHGAGWKHEGTVPLVNDATL